MSDLERRANRSRKASKVTCNPVVASELLEEMARFLAEQEFEYIEDHLMKLKLLKKYLQLMEEGS